MNRRSRGITLLECLVFMAVIAIVSSFAMRAIGQGRMMRANAAGRLAMMAIAQSELDRLRLEAPEAGTAERTDPAWPAGTHLETIVSPGPRGTLAIEVVVTRESYEGKPTVRLATLAPSAASQEGGSR